ncbi:two-component system response regulator YesN [Paenibacillus endophyticus]|uniref:Two-component system response regulator YesN n=1 Tax=Paenibacillus endophyticus TaxID=1294268 RepID=A0A7W5C537_9BACL|nr:response regulator [Paenibacillus endophyticus]MBB3151352.1 two-component system response regulator YesN [Paenibacillus endophyticus]
MIKVLIVDDESWTRDIIKAFGDWEQLGMVIAGEAEDGQDALRQTEELAPDIIITDMRMPGTDGVQLLQLLNVRFPQIKTIVVSGYDDFQYAKHALRYKAMDYLLKPVDPKELNTALLHCKNSLEAAQLDRGAWSLDLDISITLGTYKQLVKSHYNELNKEGIVSTLTQMMNEIEKIGNGKPAILEQVIQEMILLLKELMIANSQDTDRLSAIYGQEVIGSSTATCTFLTLYYEEALDQLILHRKFKNKLNLDEVRHYMDKHYSESVTLEQLARAFFVSKEYLSKMFKQEYGRNVTDYMLHLRMVKAKEWLLDETIPIKAIAEMAGYEDITYFYRVFKKHFGIAPGEMRKNSEV